MSIDITTETESIVRDAINSGHFRSVDELIAYGVQAWREKQHVGGEPAALVNEGDAMIKIDGLWVHHGRAEPGTDWSGIVNDVREERIADILKEFR